MNLPLQLRPADGVQGPVVAWFIPGSSVSHWLTCLVGAGIASRSTRLAVVPGRRAGDPVAGLLALPAGPVVESGGSGMIGCRCVAGRLHVPADAVLDPPVTDAEVRELCPAALSFLHPTCGLSAFEAADLVGVMDLLEAPPERFENWNGARAGEPPLPAWGGVEVSLTPDLGGLLAAEAKEIGSQPPTGLPPAPAEPGNGAIDRGLRGAGSAFAKGLSRMLSKLPAKAGEPTWVDRLDDWARRKASSIDSEMEQLRNRELHRLLHLLESDPERGLRHAIPLGGLGHRGMAKPSGQLGDRAPEFDPSRLGGGPADGWEVPGELHRVLQLRYREMADRELRLGRHRRAAYIYAELLGDFVSAASALKAGREFREAALIYETYLGNARQAAECLAEGGLLAEALERFEKLGLWMEVADLHEKLGNAAGARSAIERVIAERLSQRDVPGAATLIEERLRDPDRALALLMEGWPHSLQALSCASRALDLMGRCGRSQDALAWLDRNAGILRRDSRVDGVVVLLGGLVDRFPDPEVRVRAADLCRVVIGRRLSEAAVPTSEIHQLTSALTALAPGDRLLGRDVNRFREGLRESLRLQGRRTTPPPAPGGSAEVVRTFRLQPGWEWIAMRDEHHRFFAAGCRLDRLCLVRGTWDGSCQYLHWDVPASQVRNAGLLLEPAGLDGQSVFFGLGSGTDLSDQVFALDDGPGGTVCRVGTPSWLPRDRLPLAVGDESIWCGHVAAGAGILSCHDRRGRLLQTIDVTRDLLVDAERTEATRLCLTCVGNTAAMALGNRLILGLGTGGLRQFELPGQVVGLVPTLRHHRRGVVILMEHGASILWMGAPGLIELDRDLERPMAAFVHGGPLALVSGRALHLVDVDNTGVRRVGRMTLDVGVPVAVTGTSEHGGLGILTAEGRMVVYRTSG